MITQDAPMKKLPKLTWTQVPDVFFDEIMVKLSDAELRAMLYIIRRTYGWGRRSDAISLSQLQEGIKKKDGEVLDLGCGVSSRSKLLQALQLLEAKGLIKSEKQPGKGKSKGTTIYTVCFAEDEEVGEVVPNRNHPSTQREPGIVPNGNQGSSQRGLGGSTQREPTRNSNTKDSETKDSTTQREATTTSSSPSSTPTSRTSSALDLLDQWDTLLGSKQPRHKWVRDAAEELARIGATIEQIKLIYEDVKKNPPKKGINLETIMNEWKRLDVLQVGKPTTSTPSQKPSVTFSNDAARRRYEEAMKALPQKG